MKTKEPLFMDPVTSINLIMVKSAISIHPLDVDADIEVVFQLLKKLLTNNITVAHPSFGGLKRTYTNILDSGIAIMDKVYGNNKLLFIAEAFFASKYDTGNLIVEEGDFCLQFLFEDQILIESNVFVKGLSTLLAYYFRERKMKRVMVDVAYALNAPLLPLLIKAGFMPNYQTTEISKIFYCCTWESWQPWVFDYSESNDDY